jgi:hypothetical protein
MKLLIFTVLFCLFSCQEKLKIKIIGMKNTTSDTLIFNSKDTVITHGVLDSVFLDAHEKHLFTINNSKPIKFQTFAKEGMLNINNSEFIILNVDFKSDGKETDPFDAGEINLSSFVMIDSFLICKKIFENEVKDPKILNEVIDSISVKKNGNYRTYMSERERRFDDDYDTSEYVSGFKKIGNNLFIEKFWDYDINQKIPEEISVQTRSDNTSNYVQKRTKNAIVFAKDFLRYAIIMKSEYSVTDIRSQLKKKHLKKS